MSLLSTPLPQSIPLDVIELPQSETPNAMTRCYTLSATSFYVPSVEKHAHYSLDNPNAAADLSSTIYFLSSPFGSVTTKNYDRFKLVGLDIVHRKVV